MSFPSIFKLSIPDSYYILTCFSCLFILTSGHESALDDFGIYEFVAIPDHASGSRVCDFMLQTDIFFLFL